MKASRAEPVDSQESRSLSGAAHTSALALHGARYLTVGIALQRSCQAVVMIALARLLVPEDFGLMTVAVVTFEVVNMLRDLGMSNALIQRRDRVEESANVLFFSGWLLSALLYLAVFLLSPVLADLVDNPRARLVVAILCLQLFFEAAATVPRALAAKELNLARQVKIELIVTLANGVVSVVLALEGYGVWSLVIGALAGSALAAVLWNIVCSWRPAWEWDRQLVRQMAAFGATLSAAAALETAIELYSRAAVGALLGLVPVGFYEVTSRSVNLAFRHGVVALGQRIALPAFCQVQEDLEQMRRWFLKLVYYSCLLMAPLAAALVILADLLVPILLGEQWRPTIPLMRVLAGLILIMPLMYGRPIYVAAARGHALFRFALLRLFVFVPVFFVAVRDGLLTACFAEVGLAGLFAGINLFWIARIIRLPLAPVAGALVRGLGTSAYFVVVLIGIRFLGSLLSVRWGLVSLIFAGSIAGLFYVVMLYVFHRETFLEVSRLLGFAVRREGSGAPGAAGNIDQI